MATAQLELPAKVVTSRLVEVLNAPASTEPWIVERQHRDDADRELQQAIDFMIREGFFDDLLDHPATDLLQLVTTTRPTVERPEVDRLCGRARACCHSCRAVERLFVATTGREDMRLRRARDAYQHVADRPGVAERMQRVDLLLQERVNQGIADQAEVKAAHIERERAEGERQEVLRSQLSTTRETTFASVAEAERVGWHKVRSDEYGGELTQVRSRSGRVVQMMRGTEQAVSMTEWHRRGYDVRDDAIPHAYVAGGRWRTWPVYRSDQVVRRAPKASWVRK